MGRGKSLTDFERGQIKVYYKIGLSQCQIAKNIGRSQNVVSNFIRNESGYGKNRKGGIQYATTAAERRMIIRTASNSALSSAKIKYNCGVDASLATVKRVIESAKHLKRLKIKKKHPLMMYARLHGSVLLDIIWPG